MRWVLFLLLALTTTPAWAQDRDFCADRPGRGTPACTLDPGRWQAEIGIGDWTLDRQEDSRSDNVLMGDLLMRLGLTEHVEGQLGWTAYGHLRTRDRMTGAIEKQGGIGDLSLGFRANLMNPDGSGTSIAIQPVISLPVGGEAIGAGTWGASLLVPFSFSLSDTLQLSFTPEIAAEPDEDRHGRHLAYGGVAGLGLSLLPDVDAGIELSGFRDDDPGDHSTQWFLDLSAAWRPAEADDVQFDIGTSLGLDRDAPDVQLYAGVAKRF